MKKTTLKTSRTIAIAILLSATFLNSCSKDKDDDNDGAASSFTIDGTRYSINMANIMLRSEAEGLSSGVILLTGGNESKIGTISFLTTFPTSAGITGTYIAATGGAVGTAGTYPSHLNVYTVNNGGSVVKTGGYATGPIKITSHGNNEYTVEFVLTYDDGVEASAKLKHTFTQLNP